jgi:hypothetical protein
MLAQRLLDRLNSLFEARNDFFDYDGLQVSFHRHKPATHEEISSLISAGNLKLPRDYLDFLQTFNGCTIFEYKDLGGFSFLGINEIVKENEIQRQTYEEDWDNCLTAFCNIIGDGDLLCFRMQPNNSYEILDGYHDDSPQNWNMISNSFNDFLERLIDEKGRRFWV